MEPRPTSYGSFREPSSTSASSPAPSASSPSRCCHTRPSLRAAAATALALALAFGTFTRENLRQSPAVLEQHGTDALFRVMEHPQKPSEVWGENAAAPYPTGAWWLNLVLSPVRAVAPLPYTVVPGEDGFQICYPMTKGLYKKKKDMLIQLFSAQIAVSHSSGDYGQFTIDHHDALSVHVKAETTAGSYTGMLLRGSPFVTITFDGETPMLWSYDPIDSLTETVTHTKIHFKTGETWLVYSFPKLSWKVTAAGADNTRSEVHPVHKMSSFKGFIRIAAATDKDAVETLDRYSPVVPITADVTYKAEPESDEADLEYRFSTVDLGRGSGTSPEQSLAVIDKMKSCQQQQSNCDLSSQEAFAHVLSNKEGGGQNYSSELLMLAAGHHVDGMISPKPGIRSKTLGYKCMKGQLHEIVGNTWTMKIPLPEAPWRGQEAIPEQLKPYILQSLKHDVKSLTDSWDIYNYTKQAARKARLALIADELGEEDILNEALTNLYNSLTPWLTGTKIDNQLVYDSVWGGIVTSAGLSNPLTDFGNGFYNDHHFQYGYLIYAAAVLLKYDYKDFSSEYGDKIMAIAMDYANYPATGDESKSHVPGMNVMGNSPLFPIARHKDFWDYHSWASGIFVMDDSKSQESSSEAVNAYYGIALLGDATQDPKLRQWGRLLLGMELNGAHRYWHMPTWRSVYPDDHFRSHRMVGMVSATRAAYFTWFGDLPEYVHCVNMMPFTPITPLLLPRDYIKQEYPVLATSLSRPDPPIKEAWRSLVYMALAIIDPPKAWEKLQTVTELDNGLSLTNALYFAATMARGPKGEKGGQDIPAPTKKLDPPLNSWQCQGYPLCATSFNGTAWSCCFNPGGCCTANPIPCCKGPTKAPTQNPTAPPLAPATPGALPAPGTPGTPATPGAAPAPGAPAAPAAPAAPVVAPGGAAPQAPPPPSTF